VGDLVGPGVRIGAAMRALVAKALVVAFRRRYPQSMVDDARWRVYGEDPKKLTAGFA
jgi:hypothetical protein